MGVAWVRSGLCAGERVDETELPCRSKNDPLTGAGAGLTFPAMSEDSSVAMIAGSYLQRSRVHHSVAIIAW